MLSTTSLFHFTKTKSALSGILNEGFRIKYCRENIKIKNSSINGAFPMVSFCDIPLSQVKDHIKKYGSYSLALSKEWGETNGLNPVLYIERNSVIGNDIYTAVRALTQGAGLQNATPTQLALVNIFRYLKNYKGDLIRANKKPIKGYRFWDEREWRYVPPVSDAKMFIKLVNYNTDKQKNTANGAIAGLRLTFYASDIKYIILKSEAEINSFVKTMRNTAWRNKNEYAINNLISRIITVEQILGDF